MSTDARTAPREVRIAPPDGTIERWAWDYVTSNDLRLKLAPSDVPDAWQRELCGSEASWRIDAPGRPYQLIAADKRAKTPKPEALRDPRRRAELLHVFFHHELQAAELMCRALLLFSDTDLSFRRGLLRIARDEVRHMNMYVAHLHTLGYAVGDFPVRDWFWERVPTANTPIEFVAMLGVGFEGANLDHTRRFADAFRAIGDHEGARIQDAIGEEEVPHVRFAAQWLERFLGRAFTFEEWRARVPQPLSPIVMRGRPIDRDRRLRAGLNDTFIDELDAWEP